MNEENLIKALEKINGDYIKIKSYESPEYILGRRIIHFKKSFPFHTYRWVKDFLKSRKRKKLSDSVSQYVAENELFYVGGAPIIDKKGVVYSCITGGYDVPYEPIYKSDNIDYVVFSDSPLALIKDSVWKNKEIELDECLKKSNLANRYYKFHPMDFFADYDFSIYIDGNVQTVSDVSCLYRVALESPAGIAMHRHFARNCAYKDALWCEYNHRGNIDALKGQVAVYDSEGFPKEYGLCEATIIVVDLKNPTAKEILTAWWEEFCKKGSGRDQISFPYVLWKNKLRIEDVGCLGNDEYRNPKFRINAHKGKLY